MAVTSRAITRPRWPAEAIDPARCRVIFGLPADELVVRFPDVPGGGVSDPIDTPEDDSVAVLVDEETNDIVGIHVYPLLAGGAAVHPEWRALAGPNPSPRVVARFVAEVRELFERYWTSPLTQQREP